MSILSRIWNTFRNPSRFVGKDLEGNKFYEHPSSSEDLRRTKRTVKYRNEDDVWNYVGGGKRLPIQWSAWLTHTRAHAPTLEELQTDLARQQRVIRNAALIEARDLEQRAQALRIASSTPEKIPRAKTRQLASTEPSISLPSQDGRQSNTDGVETTQTIATDINQPQSWSPRARNRAANQ